MLDGAWVTGAFDRVLVGRDATGRVVSARVFDFKTERLPGSGEVRDAVLRHQPQINLYRRVVAVLTGLAPADICCELIFTHEGARAPVPWL